jgi:hypothetical protein
MQRGFLYLVIIMDWYIRYILAWRRDYNQVRRHAGISTTGYTGYISCVKELTSGIFIGGRSLILTK